MKRLTGLHFRPVEDFHRRPVRVGQLEHCEHVPFRGLVCGADAILDSCFRQLLLHLGKFLGAGHAEAQVRQVVAAVGMQDEAVMPIVHAQVAAVAFALLRQLQADESRGEVLPRFEVLHS